MKDSLLQDFLGLGLAEPLIHALSKLGYTTPTPIQAQAIPPLMKGRDLVGIAQTGTGKTAAFALPILNKLISDRRPAPMGGARVLVLSPTRELATQIAQSFKDLSIGLHLKISVIFGGVPAGAQIRALAAGIDVLVATPGRLVDHMDTRHANLNQVEFLVLDEVDQMLDLGFIRPIKRIVRDLPRKRQNLFFSATMPTDIRALAGELLRDPVEVAVTPIAKTADRVDQRIILVDAAKKRDLLVELFADKDMNRTIVFCRTKHGADKVTKTLEMAGINAVAIHGNKSQGQRERALAAFRSGDARAMVATDIAARGIDIDDVSHVVNFELPDVAEAYVHRIGRTARAGKEGRAVAFCDSTERDSLRAIERLIRMRLPTEDRRGENGPAPAPILNPGAAVADKPYRDPRQQRSGRPQSRPAQSHGEPKADQRAQGHHHPQSETRPSATRNHRAAARPAYAPKQTYAR